MSEWLDLKVGDVLKVEELAKLDVTICYNEEYYCSRDILKPDRTSFFDEIEYNEFIEFASSFREKIVKITKLSIAFEYAYDFPASAEWYTSKLGESFRDLLDAIFRRYNRIWVIDITVEVKLIGV